jgi:hypothetical protein
LLKIYPILLVIPDPEGRVAKGEHYNDLVFLPLGENEKYSNVFVVPLRKYDC